MQRMLSFSSPILLMISLVLLALTFVTGLARRVQMRMLTRVLIGAGLLLVALAAGGPILHLPRDPRIAVMVDMSPSTRTAQFRDQTALTERIQQLLPDVPVRISEFADRTRESSLADLGSEIPSDRTIFAAPSADAIVLFSDGRFELPTSAPPTFAVIDPNLESAPDARVDWLEIRGPSLAVAVANSGSARELSTIEVAAPILVESGSQVITRDIVSRDETICASLNPADPWPENDSLTINPAPPEQLQRWWVGGSPPDNSWVVVDPGNLPTDAPRYLNAGVIALDNVSADSLSQSQQDRLMQFVRDLGGGLLIFGGDRAFAAGGYPGTALETLSSLSSTPPAPTTHWILLADSSGSMGSTVGESTRWQLAAEALTKVLPSLPPNDPVSIGSFARELRWWSQARSAQESAALPLPPREISPRGPTNLQPALESILAGTNGGMPTEILIVSDADTKLDLNALIESMRSKRVRLHLLATAEVGADSPVRRLVEATGGTVLTQSNPQGWAQAVRQLLRSASPTHLIAEPLDVQFVGPLELLAGRTLRTWNKAWPKEQITSLAVAATKDGKQVLAAQWNFGAGRVVAAALAPNRAEVEAMVELVTSKPRDPRFKVVWTTARDLRVTIDAIEANRYLNELNFMLELRQADDLSRTGNTRVVPQVGPGRYELSLPAPRSAAIASILLDGRLIDRQARAGRYATEFDGIGNDRGALRELAARSGGRIIEPDDHRPIDFKLPRRRVDLSSILAASGAVLIALGLIHWRIR